MMIIYDIMEMKKKKLLAVQFVRVVVVVLFLLWVCYTWAALEIRRIRNVYKFSSGYS